MGALYQMVEDAILARLEDRISFDGLKFYAMEADRDYAVPAIVVGAFSAGEDPQTTGIHKFVITVSVRFPFEGTKGDARTEFGDVYGAVIAALEDRDALATALTSGRLKVFDAEYEDEESPETEDQHYQRNYVFALWATCLSADPDVTSTPDPPDPTPDGIFVATDGVSTNVGTFDSPWDIDSALSGDKSIQAGKTVYLKAGVYTPQLNDDPGYPSEQANILYISEPNITVRPYGATHSDPYPVTIRGGVYVTSGTDGVTLRDLKAENIQTIPVSEPTADGSPWPGHPSAPPTGWIQWANHGVFSAGTSDGLKIYNCIATGGATGFSFANTTSLELEGTIAHDTGWQATSSEHGHPYYAQNTSDAAADRNTFNNCIASDHEHRDQTATARGRYGYHFYRQSADMQNLELNNSYLKGMMILQSVSGVVSDCKVSRLLAENVAIPYTQNFGIEGCTWGRPTNADDLLVFTSNTLINQRKVLQNCDPWTNLTDSGTRLFKTDGSWYVTQMDQPPGFSFTEEGTFLDISGGGGTDEYTMDVLTNDTKRAHIYVADFDLDGEVTVDLTGFATAGETVSIYHYRDFDTPVFTGTLSTTSQTLDIVDGSGGDVTDAFIAFKA